MARSPLPLNIAVAEYPHTKAILSGRIPIEGIEPYFANMVPQIAAYRRMVRDVEFDVCELAPTTYIIARALGAPFVALPIFVMRHFTTADSWSGPMPKSRRRRISKARRSACGPIR